LRTEAAPSVSFDGTPGAVARFSLFREELRRAFRELRGGRLSPARGAAAVALGLFVGCQPIFGCHLPVIVVLCLWLRLDALIAYVAANISNPFVAPAILTAEVQLGSFLRTGERLCFEHALTRAGAFGHFAGDLAIGAPLVGLSLAAAGGALTFAVLSVTGRLRRGGEPPAPYRLPPDAPPWVQAVERVACRYVPADGATAAERSRFHYVRTKLLGDPVAKLVADVEGDAPGVLGEVLDIGAGRGQLAVLLVELGRATRARGVDWDEDKVAAGEKAAAAREPLPVVLRAGDARTAVYAPADTVLLIDLIHYFTLDEQDAILRRAAAAVRPGGRILVREADTERGARSAITLVEERVFTALRWNRGERVRFRPAREIAATLEAAGLACEVIPAWGRTPFSNVLIVGRRPGG
jgi:uncharacterized protein (DUF2062 family)/SAM-dependent methyltransferase